MPKLKIYDGTPIEPGTVALKLIALSDAEVVLAAVDEHGDFIMDDEDDAHSSGLLTITDRGRISLSTAVMPSLGFELGFNNRLILDEFTEQQTAKHAQNFGGKRAAFRTVS